MLEVPGGRVVAIAGDADVSAAGEVDAAIERASGDGHVVVDLTEATLIDSRTIGVLMGWTRKLQADGAKLPIATDDPDLLRVFVTIGLEREFDFFPSRAAAFGD